jgi:hypothetical protein
MKRIDPVAPAFYERVGANLVALLTRGMTGKGKIRIFRRKMSGKEVTKVRVVKVGLGS